MAYRLEREESLVAGLSRVVRNEIESAAGVLSGVKKADPNQAIYEARKRIKKARAALRLLRADMGPAVWRENSRLREIAGRLSGFRDVFAVIETFDALQKKYGASGLSSVRTGLVKRSRASAGGEDAGRVVKAAAQGLGKISKRVEAWPSKRKPGGFSAVTKGIEKTYRDGRKALVAARRQGSADSFHELRKRVKDQWYQGRLLGTHLKGLKALGTLLGDDHNLAVLRERIAAEPAFYGKPEQIARTVDLITRQQKELRARAIPRAERIYEETPREFRHRMKQFWHTSRSED
jgi:CHAD domain-containing protein